MELLFITGIEKKGSRDEIIEKIIDNLNKEKVENILKEIERPKEPLIPDKIKLFLSYSTEDLHSFKINDLYDNLSKNPNIEHIYFWENDCTASTSLLTYMEKGIKDCDAFIVINSYNSNKSNPVQKEIEMAVYLNKKIIPIYKNINDVRLSLRTLRCLDFDESNIQKLCGQIVKLIVVDVFK